MHVACHGGRQGLMQSNCSLGAPLFGAGDTAAVRTTAMAHWHSLVRAKGSGGPPNHLTRVGW